VNKDKKDPRFLALLQEQADLQDLVDSRGWKVVEGLARVVQAQAKSVLLQEKEPQPLFQAQGALRAFDELQTAMEQLRDADEDGLAQMIKGE